MATAGLSDATAQGRKLTPEQLRQILALRQSQQAVSNNPLQGGYTQWSDPSQTYDKATDTHGFSLHRQYGVKREGVGDASSEVADPTQDRETIRQLRAGTDGKLGDMWDTDGNYLGTYEAQDGGGKQFNQAALMFGAALGGNLAMANGAGAGGGGLSAAGGAGGNAAGGMSAVDSLAAGGGFATGEGATMVGGSALTSGAGNTVLGTTLADAGLMEAAAYGTGGLGAFDAAAATSGVTQAAQTAAEKLAAEEAAKKALGNGLDAKTLIDAAKVGTAVAGVVTAADAADTKTDDAKFNQMFDAMFADYQKMSARGDDMWQQYLTTFRPLEQQFAASAAGFDTPTRRETAANDATGQVASEYDQQRQTAQRNMLSAGVDPSTMYALDQSSRIVQAKDQAAAANKARSDTELQGLSLVKSAADFGRGISTGATQLQQVGQTGANAATNNATGLANVQTQNTNSRNALYGDLFGAAGQLLGQWSANQKTGG
jgi:hypothetical protein